MTLTATQELLQNGSMISCSLTVGFLFIGAQMKKYKKKKAWHLVYLVKRVVGNLAYK